MRENNTNGADGVKLVGLVQEAADSKEHDKDEPDDKDLAGHASSGDAGAGAEQEEHSVRRHLRKGPEEVLRDRERERAVPVGERRVRPHHVDALPELARKRTRDHLREGDERERPVREALAEVVRVADAARVVRGAVVLEADAEPEAQRNAPDDGKGTEHHHVRGGPGVELVAVLVQDGEIASDVVAHPVRLELAVDQQHVVCFEVGHSVGAGQRQGDEVR